MLTSIPNKTAQDLNIGSIRTILWLPMEYITWFPKTSKFLDADISSGEYLHVDVSAIVLNTVDKWNIVEFVRETGKMDGEWATGPQGIYRKYKVQWVNAKHYDIRIQDFTDMQERQFCVVVVDTNDKALVFGDINYRGERTGMTFHDNSTTGGEYKARNQYDCFFYNEVAIRPVPGFYETPPPVEPPHDPGPVVVLPPID